MINEVWHWQHVRELWVVIGQVSSFCQAEPVFRIPLWLAAGFSSKSSNVSRYVLIGGT